MKPLILRALRARKIKGFIKTIVKQHEVMPIDPCITGNMLLLVDV